MEYVFWKYASWGIIFKNSNSQRSFMQWLFALIDMICHSKHFRFQVLAKSSEMFFAVCSQIIENYTFFLVVLWFNDHQSIFEPDKIHETFNFQNDRNLFDVRYKYYIHLSTVTLLVFDWDLTLLVEFDYISFLISKELELRGSKPFGK